MKSKLLILLVVAVMAPCLIFAPAAVAEPGEMAGSIVNEGPKAVLLQVGQANGSYLLILVPKGISVDLPEGTISVKALPHNLQPSEMGERANLKVLQPNGRTMSINEIGGDAWLEG